MLDNTAWCGYTVGGGDANSTDYYVGCLLWDGCCLYFNGKRKDRVVIEMTEPSMICSGSTMLSSFVASKTLELGYVRFLWFVETASFKELYDFYLNNNKNQGGYNNV